MIRFLSKVPAFATASLCLALCAPTRTLAQVEATQQINLSETAAGGATAKATSEPAATAEAQLLDDDEIAALSQRNRDPGPKVRGGALSNEHLTYIVIALAAIVLVLVLR
jgi:hypothetical protein